uniref:BsiWI n=1 Tax=Bacillus sp. NEBM184 TaxID=932688 RepID=E5Q8V3_9BACI|nr:BsiWI [Bacillus sp. NEBM184]
MTKVKELFGLNTSVKGTDWGKVVTEQHCPFLNKKCIKNRKSQAEIAIGTCTMSYGKVSKDIIICPHRLLENRKIFIDCIHLLTMHEPGNELHVVSEVSIPGGNVDYFLVSAKDGKVKDFVGIELQTMDTTGTVWPERERFLKDAGYSGYDKEAIDSDKSFGMNWKHTAKTILVQLHHKVKTFEHVNKKLVLVIQEPLIDYMKKEFSFSHVGNAKLGDPLHFHPYSLDTREDNQLHLNLKTRLSTDSDGMAMCLGLQAEAKVELTEIIAKLEEKMKNATVSTLLTL